MAKPNYSYEKRQRELAKKKKKEEKAARKAQGKAAGAEAGAESGTEDSENVEEAEGLPSGDEDSPASPGEPPAASGAGTA